MNVAIACGRLVKRQPEGLRSTERATHDLVELVLYVSTDQGRTWTGAGKAKPTQDAFNYHAEKDGLYWFSVQAVDRDGKYDPPDIAQVPPALKVMIDTQRPLAQITWYHIRIDI